MRTLMSEYFGALTAHLDTLTYPMSYLAEAYNDVEAWQAEARAAVQKLLCVEHTVGAANAEVLDTYEQNGLTYTHVRYQEPFGLPTEGILLRPIGVEGKLPGVLALHDHGAFKYYGKEKLLYPKDHPEILHAYKDRYYGGRAWAEEVARLGYVVFVPDMWLWGSRKMGVREMTEEYVEAVEKHPVDSPEHIAAYNVFAAEHEHIIAKILTHSGLTWPGLMVDADMRALDFLAAQANVDVENLGCCGLSGGGLRTVFLAAMDARIKASVCVGFMCSTRELAAYKTYIHTWMMYLPGLSHLMDFADLYALHGKKPIMVQFDEEDQLFTPKGQEEAHARLTEVYRKMGAPELYSGLFFPGPHKFDVPMQEAAFAFFDRWLKG